MKNQTIVTALKLGFDYENSDFETKEELESSIMDFLRDHMNELPKLKDYCEVTGSGSRQNVNYGDYCASGEIMQYEPFGRKHRVYHSSFLEIDQETGKCYEMQLWDYSKA